MKVEVLTNESAILGSAVLQLSDWKTTTDIVAAEEQFVNEHRPIYVFCKVSSTDLASIQTLEQAGFGFSEFRMYSQLHIQNNYTGYEAFYPYKLMLLGDKDQLKQAQKLLLKNRPDDRFFHDPLLKQTVSRERELRNLDKSFKSYPSEFILGLFNTTTGKLVAFRSGAIRQRHIAHYYLSAIAFGVDKTRFAEILDHSCIAWLREKGVSHIHAVSTGFNIDELNRLSQKHNFRIQSTEVIMRKVYTL